MPRCFSFSVRDYRSKKRRKEREEAKHRTVTTRSGRVAQPLRRYICAETDPKLQERYVSPIPSAEKKFIKYRSMSFLSIVTRYDLILRGTELDVSGENPLETEEWTEGSPFVYGVNVNKHDSDTRDNDTSIDIIQRSEKMISGDPASASTALPPVFVFNSSLSNDNNSINNDNNPSCSSSSSSSNNNRCNHNVNTRRHSRLRSSEIEAVDCSINSINVNTELGCHGDQNSQEESNTIDVTTIDSDIISSKLHKFRMNEFINKVMSKDVVDSTIDENNNSVPTWTSAPCSSSTVSLERYKTVTAHSYPTAGRSLINSQQTFEEGRYRDRSLNLHAVVDSTGVKSVFKTTPSRDPPNTHGNCLVRPLVRTQTLVVDWKKCSRMENVFRCDMCGKVYVSENAYNEHVQSHERCTHENKCTLCGKTFSRSWLLKGHMRTHTGERPYKCEHPGCDKAFADRSNLRSHVLTHSVTSKNYKCNKCSRAFAQKRYLHKHQLEVCKAVYR